MSAVQISNLYRFPVKSMTPERVGAIQLTDDGRIKGDRVLGFRFRNAGSPHDWSWQTKQNFVGLVNTPALATISVEFAESSRTLRISDKALLIAEGSIDDARDRGRIEQSFTDYVSTLDINPLGAHPERQPVALLGDGKQPLFHDNVAGLVTLHSEESAEALAGALGDESLDGLRFRTNIVVSGVGEPFAEMAWIGKTIRIGEAEFKAIKAVNRCLVTHANPVTGIRDRDIMKTLVAEFTPEKPQFAIMLKLVSGYGPIKQGDLIELDI